MNSTTTNQKNPLAPNLYTYEYAYSYQAPRRGKYTVTAYCEADALIEVTRALQQINIMGRKPDELKLVSTVPLWQ